MRIRNHKDQVCLQFNTFSYLFTLKQLYWCQINLAENELISIDKLRYLMKEVKAGSDPS